MKVSTCSNRDILTIIHQFTESTLSLDYSVLREDYRKNRPLLGNRTVGWA